MIILGVDPGLRVTGFGAIQEGANGQLRCLGYDHCKTDQSKPVPFCLNEIATKLRSIIGQLNPTQMAVEDIFLNKNFKAAMKLGQVRGVIMLIAAESKIPISQYTPRQIKSVVTGYGNTGKEGIQNMVAKLLNLKKNPEPFDAADALAIAITDSILSNSPTYKQTNI
ncbi:MAG: crossover junction endodeoxyribonuclease RuvC [Nitrospinota bacterium]